MGGSAGGGGGGAGGGGAGGGAGGLGGNGTEIGFARGGESASEWRRAGGVHSRWRAEARGAGLCASADSEAECEGCGLVPTDHGSGSASRITAGVASAGGRAGLLERRTGTKTVAPRARAPARTLPDAASANDSAWSTSRCTVAFQQCVPAIKRSATLRHHRGDRGGTFHFVVLYFFHEPTPTDRA